ncbi:MAG: hypothetical protein HY001_01120 [Candidatus Portnoybacteria bacterium]|nr:hypothetical protein [Candidatus Portnoybacteria bacterium]
MLNHIQAVAAALQPYVSPAAQEKIASRIARWQTLAEGQKTPEPTGPLPLLVKKSRGLPAILDSFYFTLTKDPYHHD